MIIEVILSFIILYLSIYLTFIALRNYKAHQFFANRAPWLPIAPEKSCFSGHLYSVALVNKNWKIVDNLHKKYGKSVGFYYANDPWIATTDIELLKLVEVTESHKHVNRGSYHSPIKEFNDSILQTKDDVWRRSRRIIAPALTNHKVCSDEISGDLKRVVNELKLSLERKLNSAENENGKRSIILNVDDLAKRFSLAVIFSIGYKQDNIIDFDVESEFWSTWISDGLSDTTNVFTMLGIMFPAFKPLIALLIMFHSFGKLRSKVVAFLTEIVKKNRRIQQKLPADKETIRRRMVDTIVDSYISKTITYDDLMGNMWAMLVAGYVTAADALTCLMWLLAINPDIQEKLRDSILKEGVESDYLHCCVLETIRWHPPVPLGIGRVLKEDVLLDNKLYPAGTHIAPTIRSIHRDESIWSEADKFKPERWFNQKDFHPAAFMGFGLGPRNCPGAKLAKHEIKLALQMILMNYRIEKCDETTREYNFSSPFFLYTILDQPIKVRLVTLDSSTLVKQHSQSVKQ